MVGDVNLADTVANAAILNYVRGSRHHLQPEFYSRGSAMAPDGDRVVAEKASAAGSIDLDIMSEAGAVEGLQRAVEPTDTNPESWWQFIQANKASVPPYIVGPMYAAWSQIGTVRSGSIGEHLKAFEALKLAGPPYTADTDRDYQ